MYEVKVKKEFEVTSSRVIAPGSIYRISPSDGCLDIIPSRIEVVKTGTREDMDDTTCDYEAWGQDNAMPKYWVKYKYKSGDTDILPLDEFVNHISIS